MSKAIIGWKLASDDRARLLARFPPSYERIVADHVTLRFGTNEATPLPTARSGRVIGIANDGRGVEALVVSIEGTTERGDGSHYHITWSLADGRQAKESNDVIVANGWQALDEGVPVALTPTRWSR